MAENITVHMDKSLESLKHNFSKVRTGRANANILSDISVDYYGVPTPVTQVAAVKTPRLTCCSSSPGTRRSSTPL